MSTDPIVTRCTTCGVRLKVRDAAALGQIYPCPKCGSMVLVECSFGVSAAAGGPEGGTEGGPEAHASRRGSGAQAAAAAGGDEVAASGSDSMASPGDAPTSEQPNLESPPHKEPTGFQSAHWLPRSGSVATKRLLGMAAGGALTLGLIAYGMGWWTEVPKGALDDGGPLSTSARIDQPQEDAETRALKASTDTATQKPHTEPTRARQNTEASHGPPPSEKTLEPAQERVGGTGSPPQDHDDASRRDEGMLPASFAPRRPRQEDAATSLIDLATLLEGSATHGADEAPAVEQDDESLADSAGTAAPRESGSTGSSSADHARVVDVSTRLGMKVRATRFDHVPLIDFTRSLMRLSGATIQIDPAALRQTGRDVESAITYSARDVSIGQLLQQALEPLHLSTVVEGQTLRISSPFWEDSQLSQMPFFVGDLQQGKGSELDLASVISNLIEPDSWSHMGGPGSIRDSGQRLMVSQTRRVQFQVLVLLEKLRLARGLPPRSKIPARHIRLDSRWAQLQPRLVEPVDMSAWHPQPFLDVITQLEEASGLRILVDWQAFRSSDGMKDVGCTLVARKTSLQKVFHELLAPRQLELRPISASTVQISSARTSARRPYLEFYSLSELGESGLARLEESLHTQVGSFALDSDSDTALVLLPAAEHRELLER